MIADLKPYPAMKDSGVPWLGNVPEQWEIRRFKYILGEQDARSDSGAEQLLRVSQYTGVTERKRTNGQDEPDTRAASLVGYKCRVARRSGSEYHACLERKYGGFPIHRGRKPGLLCLSIRGEH